MIYVNNEFHQDPVELQQWSFLQKLLRLLAIIFTKKLYHRPPIGSEIRIYSHVILLYWPFYSKSFHLLKVLPQKHKKLGFVTLNYTINKIIWNHFITSKIYHNSWLGLETSFCKWLLTTNHYLLDSNFRNFT